MAASMSTVPAQATRTLCPHCGRPYRTLLKRGHGIRIDGGIKQSVPLGSQWRCLSCGKSYTTQDE